MSKFLQFGRFELHPDSRQLLVDGRPAFLGARAFDVLLALAGRRERVVSKNELLDLVWPGLVVEENNLQVQVSTLRKILGPQTIATIPGRGYRFTATTTDGIASASVGLPTDACEAPHPTPAPRSTNLPEMLPPLFGRAQDVAEVQRNVRQHRLVTVTGAGGIGKTQLARAAAHALQEDFPDGVWMAELAAAVDAEGVCATVAQALGLQSTPSRPSQSVIAQALQAQTLLLLLDNCEHVIDAVAALTASLLAGAPGVRILATSQESLKLQQEQHYRLGSLNVPETEDPDEGLRHGAIAMFVDRARAVAPDFSLTRQNLAAVIDICRHLDGIPLAIELAAARVALLGVQGLRDRLGERFRVLSGGSRRFALRRHQTLHAALDWSHGLLSPEEQAVFRRLGVFVGGFTLEAAQMTAADETIDEWAVLDHLGALVDKSIVNVQGGDAPRYALLETTHAYALEKLAQAGEFDVTARRHALAMRAIFERAHEDRFGDQGTLSEAAFMGRLRPEMDNLRAALEWSSNAGEDSGLAVALAAASAVSMIYAGATVECLAWLRRLMPRVTDSRDDSVRTRFWVAAVFVGRDARIEDETYLSALDLAETGCRRNNWSRGLYRVLLHRAWRLIHMQDMAAGTAVLEDAIRLEQPQWPGWLRSDRWNTMHHLQVQSGKKHREVEAEIRALLPEHGEETRQVRLALNMAVACNMQGEWDEAASMLSPLVDRARMSRRNLAQAAWAYGHLVLALVKLGRLAEARDRLQQALPLWRADAILHVWMHSAVYLAVAEGHIADAMRLVGWQDASPHQFGRSERLTTRIRQESLQQIEQAEPDAAVRETWRREGAALDDSGAAALCLWKTN